MTYYIEKNNKIVLFDNDEKKLMQTVKFLPDYDNSDIKFTSRPIVDFQFADTYEYERKIQLEEKERISKLSLTKREVFLALYKAKGITPDELKSQIKNVEALIEFEYANEYLRGNPLIDLIGAQLGYTPEELNYLFEYKELPAI